MKLPSIPKARLRKTKNGHVQTSKGWFILNASKARWWKNKKFGLICDFEGEPKFVEYGVNIHVVYPGQPNCHYHAEEDQEDFLILSGRCKVILEGKEYPLKQWDLVHCPHWTKHVFVGAGRGPCVILMMGGRSGKKIYYPMDRVAAKYGATPRKPTPKPKTSYKECPPWKPARPVRWRS